MTVEGNPYQLYADEFTDDDFPELIHFNCGDDFSWGRAATEWITGSDVRDSMARRGTRVWLYRNDAGVLVGFGALGMTRRRWPPPGGGFSNLVIIPMLGIDRHFHRQPPAPHTKYSHQILGHLVYEAYRWLLTEKSKSTLPLLILYVHRDNEFAIKLYERFGFVQEREVMRGDHFLMSLHIGLEDAQSDVDA
ncbi:MAG: hypothetical protein WEB58_23475 [Planctomycetaceae bacterium]